MNWAKVNQDIVKEMVNGLKWGQLPHCWIDDGEYLMATTDGYMAYFIPKNKVKFVVEGAEIDKPFEHSTDVIVPENEIRATNTYVKGGYSQRFFMRVFKGQKDGETWKTYIDTNMLKPLESDLKKNDIKFYQFDKTKAANVRPILAVHDKEPLMMMLPVRVFQEERFD